MPCYIYTLTIREVSPKRESAARALGVNDMKLRHVLGILCLSFMWGCSGADAEPDSAYESPAPIESVSEPLSLSSDVCNKVFSFEHTVDVGDGVQLRVIEKFSGASVLRLPRRAILMLPATLVTSNLYDAQVEGDSSFNALERAARAGYFAFSVDYEGYGESTMPEDGRTVTFERLLGQMGTLVEWIRGNRGVGKVDLLGTSIGSGLAVALGSTQSPINRRHVGRLILTANVYKDFSDFVKENVFTPELEAMLRSTPYVQTAPEFYPLVLTQAEPAAFNWALANFPGVYATGPTLEAFDLPFFEASHGRAPALQFWGTLDPLTPESDVETFQNEYGGDAELHVLEGGAHAVFYEPRRDEFWSESFEFLSADERRRIAPCEIFAQ